MVCVYGRWRGGKKVGAPDIKIRGGSRYFLLYYDDLVMINIFAMTKAVIWVKSSILQITILSMYMKNELWNI